VDYPYVLHSIEFVEELKNAADKILADSKSENDFSEIALKKIDSAYVYRDKQTEENKAATDQKRKKDYILLAKHLCIYDNEEDYDKLDKDSLLSVREIIHGKLKTQLEKRAKSMQLLSISLKIKINMDTDKALIDVPTLQEDLKNLYDLLKNYPKKERDKFSLSDVFPKFQSASPPFLEETSRREFLKKVLKISGKDFNPEVVGFFEELGDRSPKVKKIKKVALGAKSKEGGKKKKKKKKSPVAKVEKIETSLPQSSVDLPLSSTPVMPPSPDDLISFGVTSPTQARALKSVPQATSSPIKVDLSITTPRIPTLEPHPITMYYYFIWVCTNNR